MRSFQQLIYYTVLVMAGIIMFSLLRETLSCKESKQEATSAEPAASFDLPTPELPPAVITSPNLAPPTSKKRDNEPSNARLSRYQSLKGKVLFSSDESIERERLLSHRPTIDWIASQLTNPLLDTGLKDRLSMIDYLEDAITWEENPIRDEVVASINSVIFSESFSRADKEVRRQLIGDKIELFTILSQEFPERASALLEKIRGTKLEPILKYAVKRLPVIKKSEE